MTNEGRLSCLDPPNTLSSTAMSLAYCDGTKIPPGKGDFQMMKTSLCQAMVTQRVFMWILRHG